MSSKVYVGDTGTRLLVDVQTDISAASSVAIKVQYPDGTATSWPGSLFGTTMIEYITAAGDFLVAGRYALQAYVVIGAGAWRGETVPLIVFSLFD